MGGGGTTYTHTSLFPFSILLCIWMAYAVGRFRSGTSWEMLGLAGGIRIECTLAFLIWLYFCFAISLSVCRKVPKLSLVLFQCVSSLQHPSPLAPNRVSVLAPVTKAPRSFRPCIVGFRELSVYSKQREPWNHCYLSAVHLSWRLCVLQTTHPLLATGKVCYWFYLLVYLVIVLMFFHVI